MLEQEKSIIILFAIMICIFAIGCFYFPEEGSLAIKALFIGFAIASMCIAVKSLFA